MGRAKAKSESAGGAGRRAALVAGMVATAAAGALAVVMAVRPISGRDIGYHLAYGEHFLDTGRIVQTNRFIYTALDPEVLSNPDNVGPGCRYDARTDSYRFVNANWLSQVVMAAVHRAGGFNALVALQVALVAATFAVAVVTMRRCGLGWHWIAPALLLLALVSFERFSMRPELFGFLILAGQWCLLVKPGLAWRRTIALIGLQILAVNVHSYFLLGVALTGAMLIGYLLRWLWRTNVRQEAAGDMLPRLKWLGIATAGVAAATLCNPWLARGAVLPAETLAYLQKHNITGSQYHPGDFHPWETIAELHTPFAKGLRRDTTLVAYVVLLCVSGCAALIAIIRGRWGWVFALGGMAAVSLSARRNIGPAALIMAPLAAICLADGWRGLRSRGARGRTRSGPRGPAGRLEILAVVAASAVVTALAAWWIFGVVTQRFYSSELRPLRFGTGAYGFIVPLAEAKWINTHHPQGRIFCDFGSASNLMYFTDPRREVPLLTNTWAQPPYVMKRVLLSLWKPDEFRSFAAEYDVGVVVLHFHESAKRLMKSLADSPDWAVAHVGAGHVVFLRRSGANAALARTQAITRDTFDAGQYARRVREGDPAPAFGLHFAGRLLAAMGWRNHAITVWRECDKLDAPYHHSMLRLGRLLLGRGAMRIDEMKKHLQAGRQAEARQARRHAVQDLTEAQAALRRALKIKPDLPSVRRDLAAAERFLNTLARPRRRSVARELDMPQAPG